MRNKKEFKTEKSDLKLQKNIDIISISILNHQVSNGLEKL